MEIGIITYGDGRVMVIHNENPSLGTYIVDEEDIPQPENREGFTPVLYYTEEDGFWYEYVKNVS